jgi:Zn-dependent peptidase ImmA (M78 family)/transcriptional regulator with XRE-family HTH domain
MLDKGGLMKQTIGRNLKVARELTGISQEQFAEKLGVSRATLSAVENGHVAIDSSKLLSAARILGRAVGDFFNEEQEALALMYRAAADAIAPSDVRLHFEHFCKAYRELEEIVGVADSLLPPPDYTYNPAVHSKPLQFAMQVAYSERDRLGLGQLEPIENLFRLFDDRGIKIFRHAMEDYEVYGLSAFSPEYGACIFVNAANTVERQIFSLAHEYGHTLMHRSFYKNPAPAAGLAKDHELEQMANQFAACFLVPEPSLREVYLRDVGDKQVGVEDIVHMKRLFRVSAKMMFQRLSDLNLIPKAEGLRLSQEIEKHHQPKKEFAPLSDELIKEWESNSRFLHLVKRAGLGGMLSFGKLAELMDVPLLEARKKMQSWRKEISFAQA